MNKEIAGVVGIDDGGSSTGVVTKSTKECFPSVKGLYGERNLTQVNSKYDFIVDYKGIKYVMGTLAKYDCALPLEMHTRSKNNLFFDLSVLVALHQYGYSSNYIITSVPIKMHTDDEKDSRIARLKGSHTISVNGVAKSFVIADVKVSPETAAAFWIDEPSGKSRYIDFGSRTVGAATTLKEYDVVRFIDTESFTFFGKGLEALDEKYDPKGLADYVCGRLTSKWDKYEKVNLLGGGALDVELVTHVKEYFPNAVVMTNPTMINSQGLYNLGRAVYGMA